MDKKYLLYIVIVSILLGGTGFVLLIQKKQNEPKIPVDRAKYTSYQDVPYNPYATAKDMKLFGFRSTTTEAISTFFKNVAYAAVETPVVIMEGCVPNPVVVQVRKGKSVGFKNTSTKDIGLYIGTEMLIVKPGQIEQTQILTWTKEKTDRKVISYFCDNVGSAVGFIYVSR